MSTVLTGSRCDLRDQAEAEKPVPEDVVKIVTDKMVPFQGDLDMLDFSESNIYSEHMAKMVSWQRYYTRFWKQSMLFCDARWPDFVNIHRPDKIGATGIAEPRYVKAVTGKDFPLRTGSISAARSGIWTMPSGPFRAATGIWFISLITYMSSSRFSCSVPNVYAR